MAVLHQEIDAMLFEGDGIGIVLRDPLDDLYVRDIEFVTAGRALVGPHFAFDDHARFLGQALEGIEHFWRDRVFRDDALDDARAVAKLRKQKFAAFAQVVEPAPKGDGLAFVLADFNDGGYGR